MKKNDLPPGAKVLASVDNYEYGNNEIIPFVIGEEWDTLKGKVVDKPATHAGHVVVLWDDDNDYYAEEEMELDMDLLTLASERKNLESEFKSYQKEIIAKMKMAAKLVEEAGELADKAHARSLKSMYDASQPLIKAMDNNGWNSSSWGC